ncbi:MAG: hypothetical protein V1816_07780 [Pseudomonadota bacterium]
MSRKMISLEQWAEEFLATAAGSEKRCLRVFQKEWEANHLVNPLLFPAALTREGWVENLEWFITVEDFVVPGQCGLEPEQTPADEPAAGYVAPAPEYEGRTIVFSDGVGEANDLERTVIAPESRVGEGLTPKREAARPLAGEDFRSEDGLDDLGTLIAEAGLVDETFSSFSPRPTLPRDEATVIMESPGQSPDGVGTVIMDAAAPGGREQAGTNDRELELDDLGALIMERNREAETAARGLEPEEAGTAVLDLGPGLDDLGGLIMSQAGGGGGARKGATTKPVSSLPAAAAGEEKKAAVKTGPLDVELDLDDLETMAWFDG